VPAFLPARCTSRWRAPHTARPRWPAGQCEVGAKQGRAVLVKAWVRWRAG
jgi:hypothetical protein